MKRFATIAAMLFAAAIILGLSGCKKEPEINYYTVSFNTDGAGDIASQKVAEGKVAAKPEDPAKTGYTFCGWYNGETAFDFAAPITADTNLKAKWTIITFTVTFNTDGGSEAPAAQTVNYGSTVQKPADPTKENYGSFDWMNGEDIFDFTSTVTSNLTLKVKWYVGTKKPNETKEVGDIVFNDGSATPYTSGMTITVEQKDAAIALIFYSGKGLNSDVYGEEGGSVSWTTGDANTVRTLGVGLKHNESGLAWCTTDAAACSKNIKTIQCPAEGNAGELTFTGDKDGSDNLEQIEAFDGVDDTATVANYPAFYFAKNYKDTATNVANTKYETDWYLPSIAELFEIWKYKSTINSASEVLEGDQFEDKYFWSSSQYTSNGSYVWILRFGNVTLNFEGKFIGVAVCAIRAFN